MSAGLSMSYLFNELCELNNSELQKENNNRY